MHSLVKDLMTTPVVTVGPATRFKEVAIGLAEHRVRLVETDAASYKVRRIRRDPRITIAPCTATGRLRGIPVPARAELLPTPRWPAWTG